MSTHWCTKAIKSTSFAIQLVTNRVQNRPNRDQNRLAQFNISPACPSRHARQGRFVDNLGQKIAPKRAKKPFQKLIYENKNETYVKNREREKG